MRQNNSVLCSILALCSFLHILKTNLGPVIRQLVIVTFGTPKTLAETLKYEAFLSFSPLASVSGGKHGKRIFFFDMKYIIPTPLERQKLP